MTTCYLLNYSQKYDILSIVIMRDAESLEDRTEKKGPSQEFLLRVSCGI